MKADIKIYFLKSIHFMSLWTIDFQFPPKEVTSKWVNAKLPLVLQKWFNESECLAETIIIYNKKEYKCNDDKWMENNESWMLINVKVKSSERVNTMDSEIVSNGTVIWLKSWTLKVRLG